MDVWLQRGWLILTFTKIAHNSLFLFFYRMNKEIEDELRKADEIYTYRGERNHDRLISRSVFYSVKDGTEDNVYDVRYSYYHETVFSKLVERWILFLGVETKGCKTLKELIEKILEACLDEGTAAIIYRHIPIEYISERALESVLSKDGRLISIASKDLLTPEVCRLAVSNRGVALQSVPKKLRTLELCELAVAEDGRALKSVPEKLKKDPDGSRRLYASARINGYKVLRLMSPEACFELHFDSNKLTRAFDITNKKGNFSKMRNAREMLSACAAMPMCFVTSRTRTAVKFLSEMEPEHAAKCALSSTWMVGHLCETSKAVLAKSNSDLLEIFDFL